ncbi:3-hydroxyacyl-CoA dehydrogenase NAD-binding domain-containing protein [Nocardia miyunensis]|uniref:3-hydroxyacyl-CoA dehydrogenase NAD-binding domain-containing protein n=1 Tax=Nocardia miyunensis TaxID=282684 RepID=UPI000833FDE9|nr:3-hydroxyacyl-CoA dehydrogenase NAD-binding domain-containing protein [Nocardia miyunensis]
MSTHQENGPVRRTEADGILTLTLDDPTQSVNTMTAEFVRSLEEHLDRILADIEGGSAIRGVILTSGKKTFFAGGDLRDLSAATKDDAPDLAAFTDRAKRQLRKLETLGVPVVAAINGSALGGGLEIALACHHRIVIDAPGVRIGLPEVTLGLLPGGGGVVRSVRLLGLDVALDKVLLTGATYAPEAARDLGLVDRVVGDDSALIEAATAWIAQHPDAKQPWDEGASIPGGSANDPAVAATLPARTAAVRASHRGAPMQAAANVLSAAVESTQVDIDTAFDIETRYFVELAVGQVSKNIIQGTFFDMQAVRAGTSRPAGFDAHSVSTVGVVGAGMMGAGIALSAALSGLEVWLKDVDRPRAEKGVAYAERVLAKQVSSGRRSEASAAEVLGRIRATDRMTDLAQADLVIEAVFEDPDLKAKVFGEIDETVAPTTLLASNTSTLPISGLAGAVKRPADFVGLHFFSPVERMGLVEIVVGRETSDETVARAFDVVRQLGKTPIVVGDGRGFFTSRVILSRLLEAAAMVGEGIAPQSIEQASVRAGYPVGTLALLDELTLSLPHTIYEQFRADAGPDWVDHPGARVLEVLLEAGRPGRAAGGGFYEYVDGRRSGLWSELDKRLGPFRPAPDIAELSDRLLFAEAVDTARCLDSGLLRSTADANVGSILGIGFPRWTGGAAQFAAGYPGGHEGFARRAAQLAEAYGPRFDLPSSTGGSRA